MVVASIKEKAGRYENNKLTSQRADGQVFKQGWDCSQIGSEEEEEEGWQEKTRWLCNGRRMKKGRKRHKSGRHAKGTRVGGA